MKPVRLVMHRAGSEGVEVQAERGDVTDREGRHQRDEQPAAAGAGGEADGSTVGGELNAREAEGEPTEPTDRACRPSEAAA